MTLHRTPRAVLFLITIWALPSLVHAQGAHNDFLRSNPRFVQLFREIVTAPSESTVRVRSDDKDVALGVAIASDGWILTKAFDLKGKLTCRLKSDQEYDARLVGVHVAHDLAMLKIDTTDLTPITFKPSRRVPAGTWVASVGRGEDPVAVGVVSVPTRDVLNKGLPIAASEFSKIGYLGVALEPTGGKGVRVLQVMPKSAAAKAGLQVQDVIVSLSGHAVNDPEDFQMQMAKRRPGDEITLHVIRGEEEQDLQAKLQQRPPGDNRGELQNNMGSQLSARRSGYPTILTHDSVVKPADCGGPIVDLEGNVIGINISRAGRTESWAIPAEVIQPLLADLKSGKLAPVAATPPAAPPSQPTTTSPDEPPAVSIPRFARSQH
jgi:serine protease Do